MVNALYTRFEKVAWKGVHNLYSSRSIIRMMKSRRMKWVGHVARIERRGMYVGYRWA
jgi:hypothetical protein